MEARGEQQPLIPGLPDDIAMECLARIPHEFHPSLRPVCRQWRDLVTAPQFRRLRDEIGAAEDLVFMIQAIGDGAAVDSAAKDGGAARSPPSYGLTLHNATLGTWRRLGGQIPMFAQCAAAGDKLVLVGGWDPATLDPTDGVLVLDPAAGSHRRGSPMATARSFFALATAAGRVLVAGGHDGAKNALRSAEAYDVAADEWVPLPPMATERDEPRGAAAGKRFWAVSGYGTEEQGRFDTAAEVYDLETGEWEREEGVLAGDGGGGGAAAAFFELGGRVWCVDCGTRELKGDFGEWKGFGGLPEGLKSSPCAAAIGGAGKRAVVTAAEGAWVLDLTSNGVKWTRVEMPAGFSGLVYSAAAMRI